MATKCINLDKAVGNNIFSGQFVKIISHYKKLIITLMYWHKLHAWLSTQSSLVERRSDSDSFMVSTFKKTYL